MKKLITGVALAVLVAVPAYAQSAAPEFGSGNLPAYSYGNMNQSLGYGYGAWGSYARANPGPMHTRRARMHRDWDGM
jgi:hypothetical protein